MYSDDISKNLGDHVRLLRTQKGLLQRELAEIAGTDKETIGRIENNRNNVSFRMVKRISAALDVPLWELIKRCEHVITYDKCVQDGSRHK